MTDSAEEADGQLGDLTQNGMSERLWQRAVEPAGVIDVRYAQQKYFSILRWLGERTALLDHLKNRYRIEEALANGEHLFAAHELSSQPVNIFSTTIQSFSPAAQAQSESTSPDAPQDQAGWSGRPSGLAEVLAAHGSKPTVEPEASVERKFRISRRPPAMLLKSDAASSVRQPQAAPAHQSQAASSTQPPPDDASSAQPARPDTASPRPWADSATEKAPRGSRVNEGRVTDQAAQDFIFQKSVVTRPQVAEAAEAIENKSTSVQRKPPVATVSSEPEGAASRSVQQDAREVVSVQSPGSPAASSLPLVKPLAASPDRETPIAQSQNESVVSPLPIVKAAATPMNVESPLLSRSPQPARESPSAEAVTQKPAGITQSSNPVAVVAPEIRGDSSNLQRPEIVWRKPPDDSRAAHFNAQEAGTSAQASPVQTGTSAQAIPVQFSHVASASVAQPGGQSGAAARVQTQREPVQVEQLSPQVIRVISERVIRAITLDLKLERERRGITKWR
ncbi:MAG: hypothetical protein V7641_3582 [Blastocatellia bacterium]